MTTSLKHPQIIVEAILKHALLEVSHSKFKLGWILGEKLGSEKIRVQKELGAAKILCLKKSLVQRQKNIFSRHEVIKFQFSQDFS